MTLSTSVIVLAGILLAGGLGTAAYLTTDDGTCTLPPTAGASALSGTGGCPQPGSTCPADEAALPFAGTPNATWGAVRVLIDNQHRAVHATVCLIDDDGVKRYTQDFNVGAEAKQRLDVLVPLDAYMAFVRVEPTGMTTGHSAAESGFAIDLRDCRDEGVVVPLTTRSQTGSEIHASAQRTRCFDADDADTDGAVHGMGTRTGFPPLDPEVSARLVPAAMAFAGTLALFSGLVYVVRSDTFRWAWLGLFSRVTRPRALDQEVRAQMHTLIEQSPGVRAETIRRTLDIAAGQTAHHLRVLTQTGLVERVRVGGTQHHFAAGRYGHDQMRRLALLTHDGPRRVYEALRLTDGADVSSVAQQTGLSIAYTSRLASRLAAVGLIDRRRDGRRIVLQATDASAASALSAR